MKSSSAIFAALILAVASSPALAVITVKQPDCADLLGNLATCNQQTPDSARLAFQKAVCTSYSACLAGPEPIAPIPILSKLCPSLGVAVPASTPTQVTTVG